MVAKEGKVAHGEGNGHACKGAGGLVGWDGEVGGAKVEDRTEEEWEYS